jgi:hypothetical protein
VLKNDDRDAAEQASMFLIWDGWDAESEMLKFPSTFPTGMKTAALEDISAGRFRFVAGTASRGHW